MKACAPWLFFALYVGWIVLEAITGDRAQARRRQQMEELYRASVRKASRKA